MPCPSVLKRSQPPGFPVSWTLPTFVDVEPCEHDASVLPLVKMLHNTLLFTLFLSSANFDP